MKFDKVVDADSHVLEPSDLWEENLEPEYMDRAMRRLVSADTIRDLYPHFKNRIQNATPEDKRFILECLDTQVTVGLAGVSLPLAIPEQAVSAVSILPRAGGWGENISLSQKDICDSS